MRIAIASDHGGFRLKSELIEFLKKRTDIVVEDLGTDSAASVDYPDYAHNVAQGISEGTWDLGVLVCGTGIGMSLVANKHRGVRAVVGSDVYTARLSRDHNDANVLCLGERVLSTALATEILEAFLAQSASQEPRHVRRRAKIELP